MFIDAPPMGSGKENQMKQVLVAVFVAVTFGVVLMMSGCASFQGPPVLSGNEGAAKGSLSMGKPQNGGFNPSGSEGASEPGISMGKPQNGGFMPGGNEGATEPGVKWPQPKS